MVVNRVNTVKWNLFFHYASILIMMISGVILVPLYLHHISLGLYGAWLATGNILLWLTAVDPGLSTILQQRIAAAYGRSDVHFLGEFIFAGLLLSAFIAFFLIMLGIFAAPYIPNWVNVDGEGDRSVLIKAFQLAIIGSSLQIFAYAITSINQGLQSSVGIGVIYVIVHVLDILLTLYLLHVGFGLMALAYSMLLRGSGMIFGNLIYLIRRLQHEKIALKFSVQRVRELGKLMKFTFLSQSSSIVSNNLDAFITARFLGAEIVPLLALTRKAFDISRMIISRPLMAVMPSLSHLLGEGGIQKSRVLLVRLLRMMIWLILLVAGGLISLNEAFVRFWVGASLYAGNDINMLLCLSLVFGITITSLSNICIALGDIKGSSKAIFFQSLIFIVLLIMGGKFVGLIGIVAAPILSILLSGIWYFPSSLVRILHLNRSDQRLILSEFFCAFFAAMIVSGGFIYIRTVSLGDFIIQVGLYIGIYGFLLSLFSPFFRYECTNFYRSFKAN